MKRLFLLCGICIVSQIAVAQCKTTITLSISGCSNTLDGRLAERVAEAQFNYYMEQAGMGFNSLQECNAFRNMVISESYSYGSCRVRFNVSPCTGCPSGAMGDANILAIGQGSSFYSVNGAEEIRNWSQDDMERMIALNPEYNSFSPTELSMGDRETDMARNSARENAFVIDTSKPFRSLNVGEDGLINTHSTDLDSFDPIWQLEKNRRNLTDEDVFAYKNRMANEADETLSELLKKADMSREELENKVFEWNVILNNYMLNENTNYKEEKEILEKAYALAKYKVEYKAILNLKYIDNADEDKQATEVAFLMINGKTREQYYREELEKKEKELMEKGISPEDIEIIKKQTEQESLIKDHVSTAVDVTKGIGYVNDIVFAEGDVKHNIIKSLLSGVGEGAKLGVMVNNLITIKSYNIVADAINKQLDGLEERQKGVDKFFQEQKVKISDIEDVLKATSDSNQRNEQNRIETLKWASNTDILLNRVKEHSKEDYYGAFPDINKKEFIGREHVTTIKCRL